MAFESFVLFFDAKVSNLYLPPNLFSILISKYPFFLSPGIIVLKQGTKEVVLSGDSLTYFQNFIRKENFVLTYQEIFNYYTGKMKLLDRVMFFNVSKRFWMSIFTIKMAIWDFVCIVIKIPERRTSPGICFMPCQVFRTVQFLLSTSR